MLVSIVLVVSSVSASAWIPDGVYDKNADPDGDKLGNLDEFKALTNPLNPDTDGEGCWDGWEVLYGLDPTNGRDDLFDTDNDGWSNYREFLEGTIPLNPNTDGDKYLLDSTDPHPLIPDNTGETPPGGIGSGEGSGNEGEGQGNGQGQGQGGQGANSDNDGIVERI